MKKDAYTLLKYSFAALAIIVGIDKFTNILAVWSGYLAPFIDNLLPFSASVFSKISGVLEIILGLVILKWTRIGAYIAFVWLLLISLNLAFIQAWDIMLRDIVLAFGALSLAWLSQLSNNKR